MKIFRVRAHVFGVKKMSERSKWNGKKELKLESTILVDKWLLKLENFQLTWKESLKLESLY